MSLRSGKTLRQPERGKSSWSHRKNPRVKAEKDELRRKAVQFERQHNLRKGDSIGKGERRKFCIMVLLKRRIAGWERLKDSDDEVTMKNDKFVH